MKISVIMCTRNRKELLVRFSKTLFGQTLLPDEYIIVDSSDESLFTELIFQENIVTVAQEKNIELYCISSEAGLTIQRNKGIRKATGDISLFF